MINFGLNSVKLNKTILIEAKVHNSKEMFGCYIYLSYYLF